MATSSAGTHVRTIVLLRHAKSAWGLDLADHDRPLSGRGKRDGVAVGEFLVGEQLVPDLVLSSTATRARQTWVRAVKSGAQAGEVRHLPQIYEATAPDLAALLRHTDDAARSVLLLGHAPGVPELVEYLAVRSPESPMWQQLETKFPTSALAVLRFEGPWSKLARHGAELLRFEIPRGRKPA